MEPYPQSAPAASPDFTELYHRHKQAVHSFILSRVWNRDLAADVLQQTFLACLQAQRQGKALREPLAYLISTARNLCADAIRNRGTHSLTPQTLTLEQKPDQPTLVDESERRALAKALQQLPEEQRDVVVLKCFHGLTFERIATMWGIPLKTAASRYEYALQKLRQLLKDL